MKRLLVLSVLTFHCFPLLAQARENRESISFAEASAVLSKANGWAYNSEIGEWVDYPNFINRDKRYKVEAKSLISDPSGYLPSTSIQNFISIQWKKIFIKEQWFYVLIVHQWRGKYKYESIYKDWYQWKEKVAYFFSEAEYSKLNFDSDIQITLKTRYRVVCGSVFDTCTEELILDLIQTELLSSDRTYSAEYSFALKPDRSSGEKLRFLLPQYSSKTKEVYINKEYFEIDLKSFIRI